MRAMPVVLTAALMQAGCCTFGAIQPATRGAFAAAPRLLPPAPGRCLLELQSRLLAGEFDAVLAATPGDGAEAIPQVRLQVFPEIGGRLLEVVVDGQGISGELGSVPYRAAVGLHAAAPHPCLLLGVALAEGYAAITADRLLGERRCAGRHEIALRPVLGGRTVLELDDSGQPLRVRCEVGPAACSFDRDGVLQGTGLAARLHWRPAVVPIRER